MITRMSIQRCILGIFFYAVALIDVETGMMGDMMGGGGMGGGMPGGGMPQRRPPGMM